MQTKITTNADKIALLVSKLRKDITEEIIPKGLDSTLNYSLLELKADLLNLINSQIRYVKETKDPAQESHVNIAQSDKTIMKYFGYDLDSVKLGSYSIDSYEAKIKYIQDYTRESTGESNLHCRVQVPATAGDSIQEIYNKALKNFQDSLYVDNSTGRTKYFVLTDKGKEALKQYIKIFCSTMTGIQDGPALVKALHRRKLEIKKGLDYSFWAIKQEGLKQLLNSKNGFAVDITDSINSIKEGNPDQALQNLEQYRGEGIELVKEKIENFKNEKDFSPDTKNYSKLIELINNLRLAKKLDKNSVTYTLVSTINQTDFENLEEIFFQIKSKISFWKVSNEKDWINKIIQLIVKSIKRHLE